MISVLVRLTLLLTQLTLRASDAIGQLIGQLVLLVGRWLYQAARKRQGHLGPRPHPGSDARPPAAPARRFARRNQEPPRTVRRERPLLRPRPLRRPRPI